MSVKALRGAAIESGHEYVSAKMIADAFMADIDAYPQKFKRSYIAEKLRFRHDREYRMLSDALWTLKQRGLIAYDQQTGMWENLTRS